MLNALTHWGVWQFATAIERATEPLRPPAYAGQRWSHLHFADLDHWPHVGVVRNVRHDRLRLVSDYLSEAPPLKMKWFRGAYDNRD